jgi:2-oxoglutarate dehydrogenase E1 component
LDDLTTKGFYEIFPDEAAEQKEINRILLCSGKVFYDLEKGREERGAKNVAILRMEQLYPFPKNQIENCLAYYSQKAEVFWVQEEPRNMGPWRFVRENLQPILDESKRVLYYAGRPESASPAVGQSKRHDQEQKLLVEDSFAPQPPIRRPRRVKAVQKAK